MKYLAESIICTRYGNTVGTIDNNERSSVDWHCAALSVGERAAGRLAESSRTGDAISDQLLRVSAVMAIRRSGNHRSLITSPPRTDADEGNTPSLLLGYRSTPPDNARHLQINYSRNL